MLVSLHEISKKFGGGGLNYDLYEHSLHDSKTDVGIYKRKEQAKENIYIMDERGWLGVKNDLKQLNWATLMKIRIILTQFMAHVKIDFLLYN